MGPWTAEPVCWRPIRRLTCYFRGVSVDIFGRNGLWMATLDDLGDVHCQRARPFDVGNIWIELTVAPGRVYHRTSLGNPASPG